MPATHACLKSCSYVRSLAMPHGVRNINQDFDFKFKFYSYLGLIYSILFPVHTRIKLPVFVANVVNNVCKAGSMQLYFQLEPVLYAMFARNKVSFKFPHPSNGLILTLTDYKVFSKESHTLFCLKFT